MRKLKKIASVLAAAALLGGLAPQMSTSRADVAPVQLAFKTAVKPKALTRQINDGLAWLAKHQVGNGGWGQGDEAQNMGGGAMKDVANVADTSMALMAFLRAGHTPSSGQYKAQVKRGLEFVFSEIEASDQDSLYVTNTKGTRVQAKIGTYVDTFTALMVLNEARGTMGDAAGNQRLDRARAKVIAKIEKNQAKDGTWGNQGWAPVLTQSIAAKGLNRAKQSGAPVAPATLERVEQQAQGGFDARSGSFSKESAAGIDLYGTAAGNATLRDSANTRRAEEKDLEKKVAGAKSEPERARFKAKLDENRRTQAAADSSEKAIAARLDDPNFIRGFGNNGGEEFLSYMLLSEALVVKGGAEWKKWDDAITKLVNGVQNQDGSWSGHHCITGRTFCTAAALLVLLADRTPVPATAQG